MINLRKFIGNTGEKYAEKYLKRCGYTIIATQYRAKFIEVDIIAQKESMLYVFEVKTVSRETKNRATVSQGNTATKTYNHSRDFNFLLSDRITQKKIENMSKFADYYLNNHQQYTGAALGIIGVVLSDTLTKPSIEIIWT